MKYIIILGEEYWFSRQTRISKNAHVFIEASYLLERLKTRRDKRFEYIILDEPKKLLKTINDIGKDNIRALFLFQDVLSDSNLNNMSIWEMKQYLLNLTNNGIYIYPPVEIINIFASKKYSKTLSEQLMYAQLPHTRVLQFNNYIPFIDEKKITKVIYNVVSKMWNIFEKVVVKKGYSYESKQVKTLTKSNVLDFKEFKHKIRTLNYKEFWGEKINAINIDKGIDRYYIIQGYNKIVTKSRNEYRVFFHNGRCKYIAHADKVANYCTSYQTNDLVKHVIQFAKKLFKDYIKIIWTEKRLPILFRIDVTYATDMIFQDEFSIKIDGFDNTIRLYANEMEIDPTSYYYNKFICNEDETFSSKLIQNNIGKYINKYIRSL